MRKKYAKISELFEEIVSEIMSHGVNERDARIKTSQEFQKAAFNGENAKIHVITRPTRLQAFKAFFCGWDDVPCAPMMSKIEPID